MENVRNGLRFALMYLTSFRDKRELYLEEPNPVVAFMDLVHSVRNEFVGVASSEYMFPSMVLCSQKEMSFVAADLYSVFALCMHAENGLFLSMIISQEISR